MKTKTKEFRRNTHLLLSSAVAACIGCAAPGDVDDDSPNVNTAGFSSEVYSHQEWNELSPETEDKDEHQGTSEAFSEVVGIDKYSCTNDNYSLTRNPKEFVAIQPDASIVWLGNLIQGKSHLEVGSLQELSIRKRAPMNVSIDLLRGDNSRRVEEPSLTSSNRAIGELIDSAIDAGHVASSEAFFLSEEAHSSTQASLDLGFSAEYLGSQAEASLSVSKEATEHTFFAYFIQKAFTVSMELPATPDDVVSDEFTKEDLQVLKTEGSISAENPPLYISNIGFGRILIYKITSSHEKSRIQAAISGSYHGLTGGADGYSEADLQKTLSSAKIEIAAFGGEQASIDALIRSGQLRNYFAKDTKLSSMKPISFELRRLMDNEKAAIVRTTEYQVKTCKYVGKTVKPIGERTQVFFDRVHIPADCDGGIDKGDIFGRFDVIGFNPATNGQYTTRVHTISRSKTVGVASGNTMELGGKSGTFNQYYGKTFRISAQLKDADGGANGADDIVGNWNANQFSIAGLKPGTYTKRAVSNCSNNNPTLTYRVKRLSYIYPK